MSRTGVLLAAHGSLRDPSINDRVRHIAQSLRERGVADVVEASFHQGEPGFKEGFDRLGADRVIVVPLFTSEGYYTRTVLPQALQQPLKPESQVRYAAALGASPSLAELVRARVKALLSRYSLEADSTAVLIVGHGTRRNPESRDTTLRLAEQLQSLQLVSRVRAGFLDDDPEVEGVFASLSSHDVLVIPFLIGGAHSSIDLPRRLGLDSTSENGARRVILDVPIGHYEGLTDLVDDVVRHELPRAQGSVALVGAGPGDPGLITVRGLALLRSADVVLHDRLSSPELLGEVRPDAIVIDVGKVAGGPMSAQSEINAALVRHASLGRKVVRLKGGDPFVFGRGAEELDACEAAGISCAVVPGVSSAVAVPAAAGIPVTARGESRSFAVVTAQAELGLSHPLDEFAAGVAAVDTLVVLMGHARLAEFAARLIQAGRSSETPVACIQDGTTARQRVASGTLATIADVVLREGLSAPLVTVIGTVALRASRVAAQC
jgi:uroporphyrin-III C-methyltransferase/precorrin-2 dehydrogenase/sirohydrochlorin ferrochelatase